MQHQNKPKSSSSRQQKSFGQKRENNGGPVRLRGIASFAGSVGQERAKQGQKIAARVFTALCGMAPSAKKPLC
jgi:hypothetical protein